VVRPETAFRSGAVLGGIVGLQFSGLSITRARYRTEGFEQQVANVRQMLAARVRYLEGVRSQARAASTEIE
jgi:hypothetical protein